MPGTIQVSVLEFMDLPFSLPTSLKVSMGKIEYQTRDQGDFSFPLMSLREKMIVTLQDADGNEISNTGVEAISVVEKGFWDDFFPLEGGGHVHMKLQFVLSEEERNRIRAMRESALKKKHGELNSSPRHQETASTGGLTVASSLRHSHEVSDSQKSLLQIEPASVGEVATQSNPVSKPANFNKDPQSGIGIEGRTHLDHMQTNPNDTDRGEVTTSTASVLQEVNVQLTEVNSGGLVEKIENRSRSPPADVPARPIYAEEVSSSLLHKESVVAAKSNSVEKDKTLKPEKQGSVEKTPSNVRKMISAFESSLSQELKHRINLPMTKSQSSKIGIEAPLNNPQLKEAETESTIPGRLISGRIVNPNLMGELKQAPTYTSKKKELIGSDRALDGTKSSQDTLQLKELSQKHIQSKRTISSLEHKLKVENKEVDTKKERRPPEDLMRTSIVNETATVSGRMFDEHWGRLQQPGKLFVDQRDSGDASITGKCERKIHSKDSHVTNIRRASIDNVTNIRRVSNDKLKSAVYSEDKHHPFESSGTWIFPDEGRHLCITTARKQMMDLTEGCTVESKIHPGRTSFSTPECAEEHSMHGGTNFELNKSEKTSHKMRKSKRSSSADVEPSTGPLGQVIKVAIMVGFGVLVLLTRQRKNR